MVDQSRFQQMADQRDAMFQRQIEAMQRLTHALEGGGSGGGSAAGALGARRGSGGASDRTMREAESFMKEMRAEEKKAQQESQARTTRFIDGSLSAASQLLNAGGMPGASSVVAGFAAGGPIGAGAAAGATVLTAWMDQQKRIDRRGIAIENAGLDAFSSGPTSDTRTMREFSLKQGERLGELRSRSHEIPGARGRISEAMAEVQIQQENEDQLAPQRRALDATRRIMEPFAQTGAMSGGPGSPGWQLASQFDKYFMEQFTRSQDFEKWARVRDTSKVAGTPGQGVLGNH